MNIRQVGDRQVWVEFLRLVRARWSVVVLAMSAVLLFGAVARSRIQPLYEASARLSLEGDKGAAEEGGREDPGFRSVRRNDFAREVAELESRSLLSEVVGSCDLLERWACRDEAEALALLVSRIRVLPDPADRSLVVRARDLSKDEAAALANAIGDRFLARKEAEIRGEGNARVHRLEAEAEDRRAEIEGLERELVELAASESAGDEEGGKGEDLRRRLVSLRNLLHSLEAKRQLAALEAREMKVSARLVAPASPERAAPVSRAALSLPVLLLLGGGVGVGLVLVTEGRRSRWCAVADLMERLGASAVGFAPVSGRSWVSETEFPEAIAEPYREFRNRLVRLPAGECLFLAMMPQRRDEGFAETVVNLACVLADGGGTVLVIDADFRNAALHGFFGAAQHPGLADYLSGEMRLEETVLKSRRANLWFMPAGPRHPDTGGLLNGRRMGNLVWDMRSRFDFVLVASPSIHEVSDAGVLAGLADYTIVAAPYSGYSARRLRETKVALGTVSAAFGGVMLTTRAAIEAVEGEGRAEASPVSPGAPSPA